MKDEIWIRFSDSQLSPQVSLMWSGAGVTAPSMPVSVERTVPDATARAWLVMRTEEASQVLLSPDQLAGERAALAALKAERVHTRH
jgi:hypothetical protein